MSARFTNKVILVTGASSGLGETCARAFASEGGQVFLAARRQDRGEAVAASIRATGGHAHFFKADMCVRSEISAMVEACVQTYGGLDVAVNNAGIEGIGGVDTAEYPEDHWDEVLAVNLTGVWLCMRAELPHLCKSRGVIVNMSSIAGIRGFAGASAYAASKSGVISITTVAAQEYAERGVRINALCPGAIPTDMTERAFLSDAQVGEALVASYPMKRLGSAHEVADAVLWLSSEQSSFVTGVALPVDGGKLA